MTTTMQTHSARAAVPFADNGATLVNPGMGFTHYEYSNQPENYGSRLDYGDTVEEFPGLSTIYLRRRRAPTGIKSTCWNSMRAEMIPATGVKSALAPCGAGRSRRRMSLCAERT
jgi:hypothetical protein